MIRDFGGGSPCGGCVYLDDGLPQTYRGRIFHCEWGQGKVWAVKVAPDGAGFKLVDQIALLEPNGVKDFRPFSLRPTADGRGFYVTDWGYSGWLNKTKAGRLWKVTYTGDDVKPAPRGKDTDSIEQLIKALGHPAFTERLRAQRALVAGDKKAMDTVRNHWDKLSGRARQHGLWVLREAAVKEMVPLALEAARDGNEDLRIEAVRALRDVERGPGEAAVVKQLQKLLHSDPAPHVRMQAAASLRAFNPQSGLTLMLDLAKEQDPFVRYAIVRTLKEECDWKNVGDYLLRGAWTLAMHPGKACEGVCAALVDHYDLAAVGLLRRIQEYQGPSVSVEMRWRAVETLGRLYKDRKPYAGGWWGTQPAAHEPPAREVAWEGTPRVREAILAALADKHPAVRKAAVSALIAASDPETLGPLVKHFGTEKDIPTRADLVHAVASLKTPKATDFLRTVLHNGDNPERLRIEAIAGLEKSKTGDATASLIAAAAPAEPVAVQLRALEALGTTKATQARKVCETSLKSVEPSVRKTAAGTLAKLGDPAAALLLEPLLKDKEASVRTTAIQALGILKAKDAVPALVQATGDNSTQFEAIAALAQMPDKRALSAYLTGLASKNAELRKACREAIATLRDAVTPTLEQLAKRNEIPAAALTELREVFSSFAPILAWRVIGPFPRDGKAHPPQKEQKFDAVYKGAAKDVKWQTIQADAKQHGRVNLQARLRPNQQVVAYAYAEIESTAARDATLLCGSDDTITIWLNGKKVHDHPNDRGWNYNQDKVKVHLEKGKNRLLIQCGNSGGPWDFSVAVSGEIDRYAFLKGGAQKFDLETFRAFARKNKGDAERGRKLFMDVKGLACVKCHAIGGQGGQVGPDLAGIGLRYNREDLMTSVLEPSKVIAQGYETIVIETTKGVSLTGVFKGDSGDAVSLADNEGKVHRVLKKDIEDRVFSQVSTMPNGLSDGMTLQDFADIIAFLEARREEKK